MATNKRLPRGLDPQLRGPQALAGMGVSRRGILAAGMAGVTAAAAVPALSGTASAAGPLIPPQRRGIILYSVRDAVSRDPLASNLPSGFYEVLRELSRIGYQQIEFAGYRQHVNAPGGADLGTVAGGQLLRSWLDEFGLEAKGNHGSVPATVTPETIAAFTTTLDVAEAIGLDHVGTGNDPTRSRYKADWDTAVPVWNYFGAMAAERGMKLYTHNHDQVYNFLLDEGPADAAGNPTRSSGRRMIEYFMDQSDPAAVHFEMDVYWAHVAQHKYREYPAADGTMRPSVLDPAGVVERRRSRFPLFHAKDGDRTADPVGTGNGYTIVPFGLGDIDYDTFFRRVGQRGRVNPMWEQDTAPGGTANPAQSLQYAKLSYRNLSRVR